MTVLTNVAIGYHTLEVRQQIYQIKSVFIVVMVTDVLFN